MVKPKCGDGEYILPSGFTQIPGYKNYGINKFGEVFSKKTGIMMKTGASKYRKKNGDIHTHTLLCRT